MTFQNELQKKTEWIEDVVTKYLPKAEGYQKTVLEAMDYSVRAGGKRLRPMMMHEMYQAYGGKENVIEPFMAAIEMLHTYSLVHDDLPEMDNDELRRGLPTTHIKYGQAMAVLAGDALLNYSVEILLDAVVSEKDDVIQKRMCRGMQILYHKAGVYGMIGGQTKDVEAEKKEEASDLNEILFIDECKTAALIQASLMIGAVLAGAPKGDVLTIERIGYSLGVAFQIQDDILDVTSTTGALGKPAGSDEKNQKATYVSCRGLSEAEEDQKKLSNEAISLLDTLSVSGSLEFLKELMRQLIQRKR